MGHSFLPWMRYWARMVNNNRYVLLIEEHGSITCASSRLRSACASRSLAAAEARAVGHTETVSFLQEIHGKNASH